MKKYIYLFVLLFIPLFEVQGATLESEQNCQLKEFKCVYEVTNLDEALDYHYDHDELVTIELKDGAFGISIPHRSIKIHSNSDYKIEVSNFQMENNSYFCPNNIYVNHTLATDGSNNSYQITIVSLEILPEEDMDPYFEYKLKSDDSKIVCDDNKNITIGQTCNYYLNGYSNSTFVSITGYSGSDTPYTATLNENIMNKRNPKIILDIPENKLQNSCADLSVLYTDCSENSTTGETCTITVDETKFDAFTERTLTLNDVPKGDELKEIQNVFNGNKYWTYMCKVKSYLTYSGVSMYSLPQIDGEGTKITDLTNCENACSNNNCEDNVNYLLNQTITDINQYCSTEIYKNYNFKVNNFDSMRDRMKECINFNKFYAEGVKLGIFESSNYDCGLLSNEFGDLLKDILNIIKIAGPLLALGLGTLDFIKAIVAGDAEKEMKNAFNHFLKRIIAAVLLFLIPIILAFLMDIFLGNQDGYNSDNPFCSIVDWDE